MKTTQELFEQCYTELRHYAAGLMVRERDDHTLSATAVVNEAYLRLNPKSRVSPWESDSHFLAAASRVMRRVLIDHARSKSRCKRVGNHITCELDQLERFESTDWELLLDVDQAIERLESEDPLAAEFARLRLYSGQNVIDAGRALALRKTAAYQMWDFIESWFAVYRQQIRSPFQ